MQTKKKMGRCLDFCNIMDLSHYEGTYCIFPIVDEGRGAHGGRGMLLETWSISRQEKCEAGADEALSRSVQYSSKKRP